MKVMKHMKKSEGLVNPSCRKKSTGLSRPESLSKKPKVFFMCFMAFMGFMY